MDINLMMGLMNKFKTSEQLHAENKFKGLFFGEEGTGKTTTALGFPSPHVINCEKGVENYVSGWDFTAFNSKSPIDIKEYTYLLLDIKDKVAPPEVYDMARQMGIIDFKGEFTFKTIILDSGTILYNNTHDMVLEELKAKEKGKVKLEPTEHTLIHSPFYEIIDNIMELDVHFIMIAHQKNNYLQGTFMQIDPNKPYIPDMHKKASHLFDVVMRFEKTRKGFTAHNEKSRLIDGKTKKPIFPDKIVNFDNVTFADEIMKIIRESKPIIEGKTDAPQNVGMSKEEYAKKQEVAGTEETLEDLIDSIYNYVDELNLNSDEAVQILKEVAGKESTEGLTIEEAYKVIEHLDKMVAVTNG